MTGALTEVLLRLAGSYSGSDLEEIGHPRETQHEAPASHESVVEDYYVDNHDYVVVEVDPGYGYDEYGHGEEYNDTACVLDAQHDAHAHDDTHADVLHRDGPRVREGRPESMPGGAPPESASAETGPAGPGVPSAPAKAVALPVPEQRFL